MVRFYLFPQFFLLQETAKASSQLFHPPPPPILSSISPSLLPPLLQDLRLHHLGDASPWPLTWSHPTAAPTPRTRLPQPSHAPKMTPPGVLITITPCPFLRFLAPPLAYVAMASPEEEANPKLDSNPDRPRYSLAPCPRATRLDPRKCSELPIVCRAHNACERKRLRAGIEPTTDTAALEPQAAHCNHCATTMLQLNRSPGVLISHE